MYRMSAFGGKPENISSFELTASESEADDRGGSNQHPALLNVKTARLWRAIVPSTHLAREGRMTVSIGRRELLAALGGAAAAWPLPAWAQPKLPVVGFLNSGSPRAFGDVVSAFRQGLGEAGYVEHRNVGIEYRWAEGQVDQLPAFARELVRAQVAVICAGSP